MNDGLRIAIDKHIRCATWYTIKIAPGEAETSLVLHPTLKLPPKMRVLAFDIECSK